MFFVNEWIEVEGGMRCVSSRPFYNFEEANFESERLCREGNRDSDYTCDTANMKGKVVESL
jgi:hypothetical protein